MATVSVLGSPSPSPPLDPVAFGEDFAPLPELKAKCNTDITFDGQLSHPLKLHEDVRTGCGGQTWPAGMVLGKHLLRYHRAELQSARMYVPNHLIPSRCLTWASGEHTLTGGRNGTKTGAWCWRWSRRLECGPGMRGPEQTARHRPDGNAGADATQHQAQQSPGPGDSHDSQLVRPRMSEGLESSALIHTPFCPLPDSPSPSAAGLTQCPTVGERRCPKSWLNRRPT